MGAVAVGIYIVHALEAEVNPVQLDELDAIDVIHAERACQIATDVPVLRAANTVVDLDEDDYVGLNSCNSSSSRFLAAPWA